VLVSVTEGFAGKLHPRVREEFSVLPSDSHANQSASDPVRGEHSGKGQRPHEALGAEYAEPRGTHQREGETASLWETCRIRIAASRGWSGERPHRPRPQHGLRNNEGPLRLEQLSPVSWRQPRELAGDAGVHAISPVIRRA